ncbi:MAG: 50S ribosomal protein L25/general stress protein Ctc [Campylobacterales bacterium]|nr:50S ribosomal protein L25/general stress protein Ctc [Campylobacterales bacterium]
MLEGIIRESTSKGATKELRRNGYLIANIYAKGMENVNAAFKTNEFLKAVKNKDNLNFTVKVADKEYNVVIQEYQKDPVTGMFKHVDLRALTEGVEGKFLIPVKTVGTPIGLKNKGVLIISKKRLKVKTKPEFLVPAIEVDVSKLDVGASVLVRDVQAPAGITILDEDRVSVTGVIKAK